MGLGLLVYTQTAWLEEETLVPICPTLLKLVGSSLCSSWGSIAVIISSRSIQFWANEDRCLLPTYDTSSNHN